MGCAWFGRGWRDRKVRLPSPSTRALTWRTTGVVALRDEDIEEVPPAAYDVGGHVRTLDASNNRIVKIEDSIDKFPKVQRLNFASNRIYAVSDRITYLAKLRVLVLNNNNIAELPSGIGRLSMLEQLTLSNNNLSHIPESIGYLRRLQILLVNNNSLESLPETIGGCLALQELDCKKNMLHALPIYICKLQNMKSVILDNNNISMLPKNMFEECKVLQTLSIHANPIAVEELESMPGFATYQSRRCLKYDKQIFGGAMKQKMGFDEGFDRKV